MNFVQTFQLLDLELELNTKLEQKSVLNLKNVTKWKWID